MNSTEPPRRRAEATPRNALPSPEVRDAGALSNGGQNACVLRERSWAIIVFMALALALSASLLYLTSVEAGASSPPAPIAAGE
jgi:hypothetical protein